MPVISANTVIGIDEINLTKDEVIALLEKAQENILCRVVQERDIRKRSMASARLPGHNKLCAEQVRILPFSESGIENS
jgi:hypothetical protein